MKSSRQKAEKGTLKKVLTYLKPYWPLVLISVLLSAVTVGLTLYVPVLIGRAIDGIVGPGQVDFAGILPLLTQIGVIVAVTALVQWLVNTINNRITYQVVRDVRDQAFRRLQILPLSYIDSHPVGDIVSQVIADVDQFADGLHQRTHTRLLGVEQRAVDVEHEMPVLSHRLSILISTGRWSL